MAGQLTIDTLKASSGVLATQNGMTGIAKAWVQFTCPTGTLAITGSFNVSSVTRISTGIYQVTFSTAMSNANYSVLATPSNLGNNTYVGIAQSFVSGIGTTAPTSSSFYVATKSSLFTVQDADYLSIAVLGA